MNKNQLYWTSQFLWWFCFSLCLAVIVGERDASVFNFAICIFFNTFLGISFTHIFKSFFNKNIFETTQIKTFLSYGFIGILGGILLSLTFNSLILGCTAGLTFPKDSFHYLKLALVSFLGYAPWFILYYYNQYIHQFHQEQKVIVESENLIQNAELENLKSQLNPHFLFNSLNCIKALVRTDPPLAQKSIIQLSDILRRSLTLSESHTVNLIDELSMMQQYLELETIRFDKRLQYHFQLENKTLNFKIPSMSLHLLVDNAIKHGISRQRNGGEIYIHTRMHQQMLTITVRNTGKLDKNFSDTGLSLKNLRKRLQLRYSGKASLQIEEDEDHVVASLKIPII